MADVRFSSKSTRAGALNPGRPEPGEHIPYFGQYIARVPDGNILDLLARQIDDTVAFFAPFTREAALRRPAPGEWNPIEIAGHLVDTERVLGYRLLRIARADPVLWESIEFEPYVDHESAYFFIDEDDEDEEDGDEYASDAIEDYREWLSEVAQLDPLTDPDPAVERARAQWQAQFDAWKAPYLDGR